MQSHAVQGTALPTCRGMPGARRRAVSTVVATAGTTTAGSAPAVTAAVAGAAASRGRGRRVRRRGPAARVAVRRAVARQVRRRPATLHAACSIVLMRTLHVLAGGSASLSSVEPPAKGTEQCVNPADPG